MSGLTRTRSVARSAIRATARDATDRTSTRDALVVVAHPMDETLGCGLAIRRKLAAGRRVVLLVVADGRHSHVSRYLTPTDLAVLRLEEMREAARRLGVAPGDLHLAALEDGTAAAHEERLAKTVGDLIAEARPDEVYLPCAEEPHPDRAAAARAARTAAQAAEEPVRLVEYPLELWRSWPLRRHEVLRSTGDAAGRTLRRRAEIVKAGDNLTAKWHALQAHSSQFHRPRGVPATEPWAGLPRPLLRAAADRYELYFPVDQR
jgi:LmbE family N-acetylglucosaminyl deacetylase